MEVLIACECSGEVRRAFRERGHAAYSCDMEPADDGEQRYHLQGDALYFAQSRWDLMIAHPPCTHLAVSGARWFEEKRRDGRQQKAVAFFMDLANMHHIPRICLENPVSVMSTIWRKPDQIIQPWQFGHGETKATCLWLKGLPKLEPTNIVEGREARVHKMAPGPNRAKERSKTYEGVAKGMAAQWG